MEKQKFSPNFLDYLNSFINYNSNVNLRSINEELLKTNNFINDLNSGYNNYKEELNNIQNEIQNTNFEIQTLNLSIKNFQREVSKNQNIQIDLQKQQLIYSKLQTYYSYLQTQLQSELLAQQNLQTKYQEIQTQIAIKYELLERRRNEFKNYIYNLNNTLQKMQNIPDNLSKFLELNSIDLEIKTYKISIDELEDISDKEYAQNVLDLFIFTKSNSEDNLSEADRQLLNKLQSLKKEDNELEEILSEKNTHLDVFRNDIENFEKELEVNFTSRDVIFEFKRKIKNCVVIFIVAVFIKTINTYSFAYPEINQFFIFVSLILFIMLTYYGLKLYENINKEKKSKQLVEEIKINKLKFHDLKTEISSLDLRLENIKSDLANMESKIENEVNVISS